MPGEAYGNGIVLHDPAENIEKSVESIVFHDPVEKQSGWACACVYKKKKYTRLISKSQIDKVCLKKKMFSYQKERFDILIVY